MESPVILLTGVTGLLGKVVLEELFRQVDLQFAKVVVLVRPKRGQHPYTRFYEKVLPSLCFQNLQPEWQERVEVVQSELSASRCGMDDITYQRLQASVTHIIHCAGSVKFDSPILDAFNANITSGLNILQFAKDCYRSPRLTHISTAYVTPHSVGPLYETLSTLPKSATELYEDVLSGKMGEEEVLSLANLPNTYTVSKAITEHLMTERRAHVPLTIIRPSIISASRQYPFPGWIDSHAAFAGFVCAIGGGVLHVVAGNPTTILDIVPVDDVSRLIINETLRPRKRAQEATILYAVAGLNHGMYLEKAANMVIYFFHNIRQSRKPWLSYVGSRNVSFFLHEFFAQTLPLKLASLWFAVCGNAKKRRATKSLGRKLSGINAAFAYFTHNSFDFRSSEQLLEGFDSESYGKVVCYGVLKHLMVHESMKEQKFDFLDETGVGGRSLEKSMV